MSSQRRVAERDRTLMIPLDMGGQAAVSTNALFVGPGEPGPGDDWQLPPESGKKIADQDDLVIEPLRRVGSSFLPLSRTRRR
jgi:hypothetical protein